MIFFLLFGLFFLLAAYKYVCVYVCIALYFSPFHLFHLILCKRNHIFYTLLTDDAYAKNWNFKARILNEIFNF